ncbi:Fic family protein [Variovorax ginsengisoli]|uniref:Fic family protein n=1 Tax=Variovorax ginsengisoli TaxID=363844 RepID=A0ABT8S8Z4_9BURK|nr:Fic family protein [Variovorax ginsengisoli]MDN8616095.1 Fic family protein [Variovorax ginsengisoli]MDO1535265.1 Fic family protein [Variovorax ginsengisoli]
MPALFELLRDEPSAAVRAVLGHFMFDFIHPYMDGNGRLGRFIMNTMLTCRPKHRSMLPRTPLSTRSIRRARAAEHAARTSETAPTASSLASRLPLLRSGQTSSVST